MSTLSYLKLVGTSRAYFYGVDFKPVEIIAPLASNYIPELEGDDEIISPLELKLFEVD